MATEIAPPTNGLYGTQYGQPAELAASMPSGPNHNSSVSQSSTAASTTATSKADPQEIGWYFVEQYYTNLSKSPERIHLFYSKKSQLVAGVEAEKVVPAVGIKAISEKIKAMEIQDCKVRVLNVDSQASGRDIVVQVIGEMSNKSEPHHKFVQTFVLAEQPNGYFVLNDIFRYLNSDEDEIVEDEPVEAEVSKEEHTSPVAPVAQPEPAESTPTVDTEEGAAEVDKELEDVAETRDEELVANGAPSEAAVDEPVSTEEATETAIEPVQEPTIFTEKPAEPEPTRASTPPKSQTPVPAVTDGIPARKTWASMVGTKAPAIPVLPIAATPVIPQTKAQKPAAAPPQANTSKPLAKPSEPVAESDSQQSSGWQMADGGKKQKGSPASTAPAANTLAYIKNVTEKVDAFILKETLEKYGKLKYYDVSRQRNCAFVEFETAAGYAAAVAANPHDVGAEPIYVEERRPKPAAYGGSNANFARGNGGPSRGGRGGNMPARTGSNSGSFPKEAGRGNFQQRGAKSGNVTPRGGRSQAQAV